ncbi:MAG: cyclomaltodextrinase N-terminal domain-containing protein, partial [Verrucomicrobiales bacterium]|nr:cyclomaltodextrinase N-terminal domain-containing protein [Verrucomicrobiales bacterium]
MIPPLKRCLAGLGIGWTTILWAVAQPVVTQVEPPSWWAGHTLNPIRLLITGKHLEGGRVQVEGGGGSVSRVMVSPSGTHLFCDLEVRKGAQPGVRQLRVTTAAGTTHADFEILEPLPTAGRFQGFGPDDFVYLILPDRFANGDAANDRPSKSPGLLDRKKSRYYHGGDLKGVIQKLP